VYAAVLCVRDHAERGVHIRVVYERRLERILVHLHILGDSWQHGALRPLIRGISRNVQAKET